MNTQKIIITVLGLAIVAGLGFAVVQSSIKLKNNEAIQEPILPGNPTEIPRKRTENFPEFGMVSFDYPVNFSLNEKVIFPYGLKFPDGLKVILKEINDSRCPKNVQCIWAGELTGIFAVSGGMLTAPTEINLGTESNKHASVFAEGKYVFSLKDASATSMTIIVSIYKSK